MPKLRFNRNLENLISSEKIKFNPGDINLLKKLCKYEYGLSQDELSKKIGITIGGVCKILKRTHSFGLTLFLPGNIRIYRIVPERRKEIKLFLKAYNKGISNEDLFSCHAYVIECMVNELPKRFLEKLTKESGWLEYIPKNWAGYKFAYIDATVKFHKTKNQCKAYFFFRTIANDPHIAEMINIEKFLDKKKLLESKYPGLKLGSPSVIGSQNYCEISWLREPIAMEAIKLGLKHNCIEDSYKIKGEWEEKGADAIENIKRIFEIRDLIKKQNTEKLKKAKEFLESLSSWGEI